MSKKVTKRKTAIKGRKKGDTKKSRAEDSRNRGDPKK